MNDSQNENIPFGMGGGGGGVEEDQQQKRKRKIRGRNIWRWNKKHTRVSVGSTFWNFCSATWDLPLINYSLYLSSPSFHTCTMAREHVYQISIAPTLQGPNATTYLTLNIYLTTMCLNRLHLLNKTQRTSVRYTAPCSSPSLYSSFKIQLQNQLTI